MIKNAISSSLERQTSSLKPNLVLYPKMPPLSRWKRPFTKNLITNPKRKSRPGAPVSLSVALSRILARTVIMIRLTTKWSPSETTSVPRPWLSRNLNLKSSPSLLYLMRLKKLNHRSPWCYKTTARSESIPKKCLSQQSSAQSRMVI